ncbi:MAG: RluA family pseudouridine synthase [Bacilli bacterium]|nr:RluA family pseudouridine synthase [Bacilli bacterium]
MKCKLNIIYEDKSLLVVNKPYNMLSVATNKEKEHTLYHTVYTYLKKKNQKIYIVNRLDRETKGIVVFAKNEKLKRLLQDNWNDITKRYYLAVVKGISKDNDTIKVKLKENKALITYVTNDKDGKLSITKYKTISRNNNYSLLDIEILTGRKNQIRASLSHVNLPILGDNKYGNNKSSHMYLQAYKLIIIHPITKSKMVFEIPHDKEYYNFFKKGNNIEK